MDGTMEGETARPADDGDPDGGIGDADPDRMLRREPYIVPIPGLWPGPGAGTGVEAFDDGAVLRLPTDTGGEILRRTRGARTGPDEVEVEFEAGDGARGSP